MAIRSSRLAGGFRPECISVRWVEREGREEEGGLEEGGGTNAIAR